MSGLISIQKVFVFLSDEPCRTPIYLHGPDNANPQILFKLYVDWWNNDFAPDEGLMPDGFNDYHFESSFSPIDFYDDYLHERLNKDSATDSTTISKLEKVIDKLDYAAKYYDITIDFYEDK